MDPTPPPIPPSVPSQQPPTKVSGLAVAALVLGILGLFTFGLTAIPGLILGIVALIKIQKKESGVRGNGLAIAAICVSGAMLFLIPIMAAMLLPALAKAKSKAQEIQCMNNMKQLNLALVMYANDHTDTFPSADQWCDLIKTYIGGANSSVYRCAAESGDRCSYAFNASLGDRKLNELGSPSQVVLIFTAGQGWNQSGGRELLEPHRHGGRSVIVGFADGHVEIMRNGRLRSLHWEK